MVLENEEVPHQSENDDVTGNNHNSNNGVTVDNNNLTNEVTGGNNLNVDVNKADEAENYDVINANDVIKPENARNFTKSMPGSDKKEIIQNFLAESNQVLEEIVTVNVSGMTYDIDVDDLRRSPSSRLYRDVVSGKRPLVFKRPIQSFDAVLAYYQTGDLHMPTSVCPGSFKTELEFWGLDPQIMAKCCYYRYLSFHDDQETLDKFHQHLFPEVGLQKTPLRCLGGVRQTLWRIFDFHDKSIITKIYFWLCTIMVVLSVLTLALSSLPEFRRNLTKCELEEFLGKPLKTTYGKHDVISNDTCSTPVADDILETIYVDFEVVNVNKSKLQPDDIVLNDTILTIINETKSKPSNLTLKRGGMFLNELPAVSDEKLAGILFEALRPKVGIGKKTVRIQTLVYIDFIVLGFFTSDLLLRMLCCPSIRRYFLSMINVIDALVVLSGYSLILVNYLKKDEKYEVTNYDLLEIFQVLRVVRLIRIVRDVIGFKVLTFSLRVTVKDLSVLLLYLTVAVVIFANFIFFVESSEQIESVPVGWWWAISTLTTVGYGDVVPRSLYGRIIGGICAISGVVMISVAIPVVVKTFILLYAYAVLYKKSLHKPEDTHRYIHRHAVSGSHVDLRN